MLMKTNKAVETNLMMLFKNFYVVLVETVAAKNVYICQRGL